MFGDRYAQRVIAGVLAKERARRTGHPVRYEDPGIMSMAEEIVEELAAMNGSSGRWDTVIFKDGALGFVREHEVREAGYSVNRA